MPVEQGYQSQIMPRAAAAMPLVSPDAMGAGIGDAIAQAGQTVHQIQLRAYQAERQRTADSEAAAFQHSFAQVREDMDNLVRTARDNAAPGAAGHSAAMREALAVRREQLLGGITDERLSRDATGMFENFALNLHKSEADFEDGQRIGKLVTDQRDAVNVSANRLRNNQEVSAYLEEMDMLHRGIDAMTGVPANVRDELKREGEQNLTVSYMAGMVDARPESARGLLDRGEFNEWLTPQQIDQLRNGADVEIRRQEAAAEHERQIERAALTEQIATVRAQASQGIDVSAAAQQLRDRAAAAGDTSTAVVLDGIVADGRYARIYNSQTPVQREAAMGRLSALTNPSAEQQRERAWLQAHGGALDTSFNNDPVTWASENAPANGRPPELVIGNPASVAARAEWARSMARAYGRPFPVFSANEAVTLRARADAGPPELLAVANEIGQFGGRTAINAAAQVAPSNAMLRQLVTLPPQERGNVIAGIEVRRGNNRLIDGAAGEQARQIFDARIGSALGLFPADQRNAVFEAARNIYAHRAGQRGQIEYNPINFIGMVERGVGAPIGQWQRQPVILPRGMNQAQFERRLMAYRPSNSENAPVLRNGQPMTAAQLRTYIPRLRPDGLYEMHSAQGGVVAARNGRPFVLDLTPGRAP